MQVHRAAGLAAHRLGHERRAEAVPHRCGLDGPLQQHRVVAGQDRVVDMVQIDFKLGRREFGQRRAGGYVLGDADRVEIGEKIVFLKDGWKAWEGSNKDIFRTDNEAVTNFVYSSELFKKVRQMYLEERN